MSGSNGWAPYLPLGEVVRHRKEFIEIDDYSTYKRCRVQLHAKGILLRDEVEGAAIKTKKQQVCRPDEFLVAEIDAKMGGFGIVPDELEGAIVSSHYFLFDPIRDRLDPRFLGYYCRTPTFRDQVTARGTTNYAAIRPGHVLDYTMPVPPLADQQRIVAKIESLAEKIAEAQSVSEQSDSVSDGLLASVYREMVENAPRKPLADVAPLDRRPVEVTVDGVYPGVSVRSFGKGCFHNPPLYGSEITWQKPHLVREGDILVSNIKAWEGAIAVARPEDDGRFGSHRYLTFRPIEGVATARFLAFHLLSGEGLYDVGMASPGSADRNRTLRSKEMLAIQVPVPDYGKQLEFDSLVDRIDMLASERRRVRRKLEAMIPSILDRAFCGEL